MFKSFKFYEGQVFSPEAFLRILSDFGYKREAAVSEEGEFARRGGIIDVFPTTFEYPVRVEWEADSILSINSYSLTTGKPFWNHKIVILLPRKSQGRPFKIAGVPRNFPLNAFVDINRGDYVVHPEQGIGLYEGIEHVRVAGENRAHMVIKYRDADKLLVPAEQMHLVQKYVCPGRVKPRLNRMGSGEWKRTKLRARKATLKVAGDLLQIQALRKALGGYAFSKDTEWQKKFEALFPFSDTPDQAKAAEDTKRDMESSYAMDRLLCGEVGYGKTEVAMRAAFKCVMDNKQVAFLVPTTILAEQHYQNFRKRLENFPLRVEMLSRFRTSASQRRIIEEAAEGRVDILVGTHRLISKDIRFKDLGLVIIDEEQRFGVKDKEKFKELRALVDILTLSATPIPRTLYMSLMGAKEISIINTPPENRIAIETHVVQYDRNLIAQAIERELKRQGQVFFVHNRVEDIERVKEDIEKVSPAGARVSYAHGQMPSKMLERIMVDFLNNRIDVLVSTTIIESGIDVPNANTIIINNADQFGLADLHQMRGRVGRFTKKAYAYFVVHPGKHLSTDANKRLEAIHDYAHLGAGFHIAMEDLEIRGAGNLLGEQQHGHIAAVGFDLYCRLLRESVSALQKTLNN